MKDKHEQEIINNLNRHGGMQANNPLVISSVLFQVKTLLSQEIQRAKELKDAKD